MERTKISPLKGLHLTLLTFNIVLLTGITVCASAQDRPIPANPAVRKGMLKNGLVYYIRRNKEPSHRAEFRLVVHAGSLLENDNQVGLAHIVEHLCFEDTKNFKNQELIGYLENNGLVFGADMNATTDFDATIYKLKIPTDNPALLKMGFRVLEDWAHNALFRDSIVNKVRKVVGEEWRLGLGAGSRLTDRYLPEIFKDSRYSRRLPIGTKQNIDTFPVRLLQQYYSDWYRPDLEAIVVVGDVNIDEIESTIKTQFGNLSNPKDERPLISFPIATHNETYTTVFTDPEQRNTLVQLIYLRPAGKIVTTNEYKTAMVAALYNEIINGRIAAGAGKETSPYFQATSSFEKIVGDKDGLILSAVVKGGAAIKNAMTLLLKENERAKKIGFTDREMDRAKRTILSKFHYLDQEKGKLNSVLLVQELINNYLNGEPYPGIAYEYRLNKKILPEITSQDIQDALTGWMAKTDRIVLVAAPQSEAGRLIDKKEIDEVINQKIADSLGGPGQYAGYSAEKTLTAHLLPAGRIVKEKRIRKPDITEWTLSNGAKVVLKQTDFKNDEILFSAISHGGSSLYPDRTYLSAASAAKFVTLSGVGDLDIEALNETLAGKQLNVAPYINAGSAGISANATKQDLETALQLMYCYFVCPRLDSTTFRSSLSKLRAVLASKQNDPDLRFADSLRFIRANYNPRYRPVSEDRLQEFNRDSSLSIYKERFADAGQFVFTFVGNFAIPDMRPLVETYIGSLPGLQGKEKTEGNRKGVLGNSTAAGSQVDGLQIKGSQVIGSQKRKIDKVIYLGNENRASVAILYNSIPATDERTQFEINQVCKILETRLTKLLREEEGKVYGISVTNGYNDQAAGLFQIIISGSGSPGNISGIADSIHAAISALKQTGISKAELDNAAVQGQREWEVKNKENSFWRDYLEQKEYYGSPLEVPTDFSLLAAGLTTERSKQLVQLLFKDENQTMVIKLPAK